MYSTIHQKNSSLWEDDATNMDENFNTFDIAISMINNIMIIDHNDINHFNNNINNYFTDIEYYNMDFNNKYFKNTCLLCCQDEPICVCK
tara:strand:+ start:524 stop:790 length:267 start_codon:yes stop_codon:yes gene_type:complete